MQLLADILDCNNSGFCNLHMTVLSRRMLLLFAILITGTGVLWGQCQTTPIVTGPEQICLSSDNNVYTTQAGMNNYSWNASAGGNITSGAGSNTISVIWGTPGTHIVNVNFTDPDGCTSENPVEYNVIVSDIPAVSVHITASSTAICEGTPVTFNAQVVNEGSMPLYQWNINGVNTGNNSNVFTSSLLVNGDRISVELTSNILCPSAETVTSNIITMTVNTLRIPSVTILESANPVCAGTNVSFTATEIFEGGISPLFQWLVNGINTGVQTNDPVFTIGSLNDNDQVQVLMTSSVACAVNPAPSNMLFSRINPIPSITSIFQDQTYCNGLQTASMALTGTPVNVTFDIRGGAGSGLSDQDDVSSIPSFTPVSGYSVVSIIPRANGCAGIPVSYNINVNATPEAISPGNLNYCAGETTSPLMLAGSPSGVLFDISGGTSVGLSEVTGIAAIPAFTPVEGNAVITIIPRTISCVGLPITFNINVNAVPAGLPPSDQNYCNGALTAPISLTGSSPGIIFDVTGGTDIGLGNLYGVSSIPVFSAVSGSAIITIIPMANSCTGEPVTFTINVNPTPSITAPGDQTYCNGFASTEIPLNGFPAGVVFDISGGNSIGLSNQAGVTSIPVFTAVTGTASVTITPRANNCTGLPVNYRITVNPNLPVSVSVAANNNPVCSGTGVTFSATPVNGGSNPSYQWRVNGIARGSNNFAFTYVPLDADRVTVEMTSGLTCTSSNPASGNVVTMTVFSGIPAAPSAPLPPSGQSNSMCPVASGLRYSIPAASGALSYIWNFPAGWTITAGQGTTSVTVTAGIQAAGNKNITVTAINTCGSSTGPPLVITVGTFASVEAGSDQTVCAGTSIVRLSGTIGGATGNNDWSWSAPSGNFSPNNKRLDADYNIPASIVNGGSVIITMTARTEGTCPPATDQMTINVRPLPVASINVSGANPLCAGSSSEISFTATPNTTISYRMNNEPAQLISVGPAGVAIHNTGNLAAGTTWYSLLSVAYTSFPECSQNISGSVSLTVNPAVLVSAGPDQRVCASDPVVTLAAYAGGGASSGSWSGGTGIFTPDRTILNAVYSPSASEIAQETVSLTFTTNDPAGPCGSGSDQITIIIDPQPIVNAGSDQIICAGSTASLAGSLGGSALSGSWSGGTGVFLPNRNTLIALYTPSSQEINSGSVILTLNSNEPDGPCSASTSQVSITINPVATASAGADQIICAGSTLTIAGIIGGSSTSGIWSGGAGLFSDHASLSTVYTPGADDITSGFVILTLTSSDPAGPCGMVSDQVRITINTQPVVIAGSDQIVCAGSAVTLSGFVGGSASFGIWSGGTGSYSPGAASVNTVYTPSATEISQGSAELTLTTNDPAGVCTAASDRLSITINSPATVNAGTNQTICSNGSATLLGEVGGGATSGTWNGGTGTFLPDRNALNAIYTPSLTERNAGSVTLTLRSNDPAGPCGVVSASTTISIRRAVQITTQPSNVGLCASFPATLSVVAAGAELSYQWYRGNVPISNSVNISGSTSPSIHLNQVSLSDAGVYFVVVSGASQCSPVSSNTVTMHVDQAISFSSQPVSLTACINTNIAFSVIADANGSPLTYQWRRNGINISGATSSTYTINNIALTSAGSYDVIVSGTAGYMCSSANSAGGVLTVTPNAGSPVFVMGPSSVRCQGTGTAAYTASAVNSTGIRYSLDANSLAGGNNINSATGVVTYLPGWSGTSLITAFADGCNGPAMAVHTVSITPSVSSPVFVSGTSSIICQGSGTITYFATATNSTGISYILDAASVSAGNTINASTGHVNYSSSWTGLSTITATASGCNGPAATTHRVTITPTVGTPYFVQGSFSSRCQGSGSESYNAIATNATNTGYSLDAASLSAGNTINPSTGIVSFLPGWSGTSTITATAEGCNGPSSGTHRVTVIPLTSAPVFIAGTSSERCQGGGMVSYSATAVNSSRITYSLDAASTAAGNSINATTGIVTYTSGWNGVTIVTATSAGCGGPLSSLHTVTSNSLSSGGSVSPNNSIVCYGSNPGLLTLTGYNGIIRGWEFSTDAGSTWQLISNTSSFYSPVISQSTAFRAVIQSGNCPVVYSSPALVSVIPLSNPVITTNPQPPVVCYGQSITLNANNGLLDGPFMNGSFSNANPTGWCRDNRCTGDFLPAHRDNETTGAWGESNGPKDFGGVVYSSQSGKFAVAGGSLTSTLETPRFSLFGAPPATLYWREAYNLVNGALARVEISTDGGANYTILAQYSGSTGNYQAFRQSQLDITGYLGQTNLRVRFTFTGSSGSSWAIDDVMVTPFGPAPVINYRWTSNPGTYTASTDTIVVRPVITTTYTLTTSITTPYGICPVGSSTITVVVNPLPVCTIIGTEGPVCPSSLNAYTAPSGMRNYSWSITGNGSIEAGRTSQNVTIRSGTVCNSSFVLTLTITDNNGCLSVCSRTVIVADNTPPVVTGCPPDQTFCEVPGQLYSIASLTNTSDNCSGAITVSYRISGATTREGSGNNASGLFNTGVSVITWFVTDFCGNITGCTTNIIVNQLPFTSPVYHR